MKQQTKENHNIKAAKTKLGKSIKKLREQKGYSQRELARAVDLPPSNMKYIEDGVNAPSPEKYLSIIRCLLPNYKDRDKLDSLYSIVRGTPPPDVCNIICDNKGLNDVLRIIDGQTLSINALIEGLSQNQDFFTLLLQNEEMKKEVLGIFAEEVYNKLREN